MATRWQTAGMAAALLMLMGCGNAGPGPAPRALAPQSGATVRAQWGPASEQLVRQLVLAAFDRADRNHDRFLDAAEFPSDRLKAWDTDHDGRLTTWEWTAGHPVTELTAAWQKAGAEFFARLDVDQNGLLSRAECKALAKVPALKAPNEQVYDRLFDRYAGLTAGVKPALFPDYLLALAFDAGRFAPIIEPPVWPAS